MVGGEEVSTLLKRGWVKLSALRRGPFQTAGIHAFIAVRPLGLFGYPFVDKILKGEGEKKGRCRLKVWGKLLTR